MANTCGSSLPLFPEEVFDPLAMDVAPGSCVPAGPAAAPQHLVGIARLAAAAPQVDEGHQIEFRGLPVRSLLNRTVSKRRLRFSWSINPYRGCEFACRYCYARYTHEYMELRKPEDFERRIFVKENAAWLLRQELRQVKPGEEIAIGTATDPYQPIERRARVMHSILEVLAEKQDLQIGIVSKSNLIERDIALLQRVAARNKLVLHTTITTRDAALARLLEPRAPRPDLRFRAVKRLRAAGLRAGILCSPLLPGLTDTGKAMNGMAEAAKAANASFLYAQPLFLKPCSKEIYLEFIREHFPHLEKLYRERFDSAAFVPKAYYERTQELLRAACKKHGLAERSGDALLTHALGTPDPEKDPAPLFPQLRPRPAGRARPSAISA